MQEIEIAGHKIGPGHPCFIIAEVGVNHNGSVEMAKRLIDAAAVAGVDAVKFQTFKAERLASPGAPKAEYQSQRTKATESQLEMLRRLELPPDAFRELQSYCQRQGLLFLSTPFDEGSVDLLNELNVPAFKIGSGEITNPPLLEYIALKKKPVILSTGMSSLSEVDQAIKVIHGAGQKNQLILLHCVSCYPANPADVNLKAIQTMAEIFQVPVGYSDHTLGVEIAVAAVALGACVIEKHFTLDRDLPGPDHQASLEPRELKEMVRTIRNVEKALGHGAKRPTDSELSMRHLARRSLVAIRAIPEGVKITRDMIAFTRPGSGIAPSGLSSILGRFPSRPIEAGEILVWELFQPEGS